LGKLTPETLWNLKRISGGTLSPDGKYLLYSQRTFDLEKNKGNTDLFIINGVSYINFDTTIWVNYRGVTIYR
jgi:hypothetical protein